MVRSFACVALALVVFSTALGAGSEQATMPLSDFGEICYPADEHPPDAARTAALIRFVFAQFPDVEIPPTHVEILTFEDYETAIAMLEAGPRWERWLFDFRQQTGWMASAVTEIGPAREGELRIKAYQPLGDNVLIHEVLHYVFEQLAPRPLNDTSLLNMEPVAVVSTAAMMTSRRYRAFLRERSWLDS